MRCHRAAAAALGLTLAACAPAPVMRHASPQMLLEKCGVANAMEPVLCGDLPVPEDRRAPGGRQIPLNIVVIPALGEKTLPPLYDLAGGPGLPATGSADFWISDGAIHRAHRDIVLVDQRGTGASHPLPCPVFTSNPYRPVLDDQDVSDCRDTLAADADLSQYSTAAAVQDLEAVRAALGHERIDLSGISYGTRLAQEYLRAYPSRVRAMVLLGTLSPAEKLPLSFAGNAAAMLERLAAQCAGDAACRKAVPNLAGDISKLDKNLEPGSLAVTLPDGRKTQVLRGPFWEAVRAQFVSVRTQRELPWLLHQAARGRFAPILAQLAPTKDSAATGLLLSVTCPEDTLHIDAAELTTTGGGVFGTYRVEQQMRACKIWGVPPVAVPRDFVESDVPALLMAGELDAITPPKQAQDVAAHLRNSRVVIVPSLGHFPDGLSHPECYDKVISDFFAAGSAANLDTSCLATMQPPAFRTKTAPDRR